MVPRELTKDEAVMNLSFAGCGFLGIYHVGVASCIQKYAPQLTSNIISGASAGSLVAAGMLCGLPLGEAATFTLNLATKARARALGPLHPSFNIVTHLETALEVFLPPNAHEICTGRLFVSLTRVNDRQNVLISNFESKADLIHVLLCSAHVPFWSGIMPPEYKGVRYVDGGLSLNNPILNENTITVSPFSGESDICPDDKSSSFLHLCVAGTSIQLNCGNLYRISHAFFPPPPEILSSMCKQGFDDALKYLQKNNLISCTKHLSVQSSVYGEFSLEQLIREEQRTGESDDSNYEGDDDQSEDSGEDERFHCNECKEKLDSNHTPELPPAVIQALQAACDSVNKGLLAPIYNMRAFKVISLMTVPWILPFDVSIALAKKFYDWGPKMPSDMQWAAKELIFYIKQLYKSIQTNRHHYSARFTCQLAITDFVEPRHPAPAKSRVLPEKIFGPAARRRDLGMDFSVDFHSRSRETPLDCADDLRHFLERDSHTVTVPVTEKVEGFGQVESKSTWQPSDDAQMHYDSFENCLHIANQMDSILSFYYMEEDDPTSAKVVEIFPIEDRMQSPIHTQKPSHEQAEKLFDEYMEKHERENKEKPPLSPSLLRRCNSDVMSAKFIRENNDEEDGPLYQRLPSISEESLS